MPKKITKNKIGYVISVYQNVVFASGLLKAMIGETILFSSGVKGMVINLLPKKVGIIVFADFVKKTIKAGDQIYANGKMFHIPVSDMLLGKVITPLGKILNTEDFLTEKETITVDNEPLAIFQRKPVTIPLETGIIGIDALIPIGKGQRQLIIGDRKTGKTTIALNTILNQRNKKVICIYVSIGQKESNLASLVKTLELKDAFYYTVVINAGASFGSSLIYLAPFTGASIAEYFAKQGKDVLIIYDDLTKHANSYREISLLMDNIPGREAYPGDIFYLHAKLLERAGRFNKEAGNGSITALPIVEIKDNDISAFVPTNIISITDGQIFLEKKLFDQEIKPAINYGLSVSRLGGSVQIPLIKKLTKNLRINLANYQELSTFSQFGTVLDAKTKKKLVYGQKTIEILKQKKIQSFDFVAQTIILYALNQGYMENIKINKIIDFKIEIQRSLMFNEVGKMIHQEISKKKLLPDSKILHKFLLNIKRFL